jgi:aminoglycoside 6'-N-acetyltransferase
VLHGERVTLRPVAEADVGSLAAILREPSVARWWGTRDADESASELVHDDETVAFAIDVEGEVVGCVQYHEELEPDYRHAGLDVFVAAAHQGAGLGSEAVRVLARHLFEERGHHRLTIDPAAANERAIRAYERVGFRAVGIMRLYERGRDGTWHDGLLMDLLDGELR